MQWSDAVMMVYGMGLTQQVVGVHNVHMVANLALLRGNIGKPGANIYAVRGHSNVQRQRTVRITEKPSTSLLSYTTSNRRAHHRRGLRGHHQGRGARLCQSWWKFQACDPGYRGCRTGLEAPAA
jgi:anaerobic selenocysteine-containing dehydrogenase